MSQPGIVSRGPHGITYQLDSRPCNPRWCPLLERRQRVMVFRMSGLRPIRHEFRGASLLGLPAWYFWGCWRWLAPLGFVLAALFGPWLLGIMTLWLMSLV